MCYANDVCIHMSSMRMMDISFCHIASPVGSQMLKCQINGGVASCPPVACPGDQVTLTWTAYLIANNLWVLPSGSCSSSNTPDSIVLTQTVDACRRVTTTCGPYTATNVDSGPSTPCLNSTLTVRVNTGMTSSLIMVGTKDLSGQNAILNATQIGVMGKDDVTFVLSAKLQSTMLVHIPLKCCM